MRPAVFFRLRLRLRLQNTAELLTLILSPNLVQNLGGSQFGNAIDARDMSRLHEAGIVAIVDVAAEEPAVSVARDMTYCRFPLVDGDRNNDHFVYAAVDTTATLIRKQVATLVACSAGMSRSPAVVAAALAIVEDTSPDVCLERVVAGHAHDVSPKLWNDIVYAYTQIMEARRSA
jgi:hypothetical protein